MNQFGEVTSIPGCLLLRQPAPRDVRGVFSKLFHAPSFDLAGVPFRVAECFWSTSHRSVIRGLHFQTPPHDHQKLVSCLAGEVRDVVVDLRRGSPAYGHWVGFDLRGGDGQAVLIPRGCAHGFQALCNHSTMLYLVDTAHAPAHDGGIRWDSCGITWSLPPAAVSERDQSLPPLEGFKSPFSWSL